MRLKTVDAVRAMAIVLVVLGHALIYANSGRFLMGFIYSFHMSLLFVLSGFVAAASWKRTDVEPDLGFAVRKIARSARRLLVPYAICGAVVVPLVNAFLTHRYAESFLNGWRNAFMLNKFLWYLPCCFFLVCIFVAVSLAARHGSALRRWVVVGAAFGMVVALRLLLSDVDYIRSVMSYFLPFFAGVWLWSRRDVVLEPSPRLVAVASVVFVVLATTYASLPEMPLMVKGIVKPLAGIAALFPMMAVVRRLRGALADGVANLGRITLFLYCFDFCATPITVWYILPHGVASSCAVAFGVVTLGVFLKLAFEYAILPEIKRIAS